MLQERYEIVERVLEVDVVFPERVVCVDDQAEVRRLLGDVFRAKGGNVVSFDDGEDAIRWLGENDADLVILDLDLGPNRRTGIEICKAIRGRLPEPGLVAWRDLPDAIVAANIDQALGIALDVARGRWPRFADGPVPFPAGVVER